MVKIAVIGAGVVGQMHLRHLSGIENCQVVGLADLRPELLKLAARKFNVERTFASHRDLLASSGADAVYVVTARNHTFGVVEDCLKAGKHVFSEKPMAKTLAQAERLVALARENGCQYSVGYQRRHDAGTKKAKALFTELLNSGSLGPITFVRSWNFTGQDRYLNDDYIMTEESRPSLPDLKSGSPTWLPEKHHYAYDRFVNVFAHDTNILRHFFGVNPSIRAANLERMPGGSVSLAYESFSGVLECGLNELNSWEDRGEWDEGIEVRFQKGILRAQFQGPLRHDLSSRVTLIRGSGAPEIIHTGAGTPPAFHLQARDFVDSVALRTQPLASGEDALLDLRMHEEIWRRFLGEEASLGA